MNFNLGRIVTTPRIASDMNEGTFHGEVIDAIERYKNMDWGLVSPDSKELNDEAVKNDDSILAIYPTTKGKIWILTDWEKDFPHTIIMYPDEY